MGADGPNSAIPQSRLRNQVWESVLVLLLVAAM